LSNDQQTQRRFFQRSRSLSKPSRLSEDSRNCKSLFSPLSSVRFVSPPKKFNSSVRFCPSLVHISCSNPSSLSPHVVLFDFRSFTISLHPDRLSSSPCERIQELVTTVLYADLALLFLRAFSPILLALPISLHQVFDVPTPSTHPRQPSCLRCHLRRRGIVRPDSRRVQEGGKVDKRDARNQDRICRKRKRLLSMERSRK